LPSVKGALRFWYRAIDPEYRRHEMELFGGTGTGQGQARFLMKAESRKTHTFVLPERDFAQLQYVAYSLGKRSRRDRPYQIRQSLRNGQTFTLHFLMRPFVQKRDFDPSQSSRRDWQRLLASLWLLGHIGGLGSRSRRGFGSVALKEWKVQGDAAVGELLEALPLPHQEKTAEDWMNAFCRGLAVIRGWFPGRHERDHLLIDDGCRFFIGTDPTKNWTEALKQGADAIREFRQAPENRVIRVAVGLPIIQKTKTRGTVKISPAKDRSDRMASPFFLRVIHTGQGYVPFFALLSGPEKVEVKGGRMDGKTVLLEDARSRFADFLQERAYEEVDG
jgi:CRISPR-associated protein Cmr1